MDSSVIDLCSDEETEQRTVPPAYMEKSVAPVNLTHNDVDDLLFVPHDDDFPLPPRKRTRLTPPVCTNDSDGPAFKSRETEARSPQEWWNGFQPVHRMRERTEGYLRQRSDERRSFLAAEVEHCDLTALPRKKASAVKTSAPIRDRPSTFTTSYGKGQALEFGPTPQHGLIDHTSDLVDLLSSDCEKDQNRVSWPPNKEHELSDDSLASIGDLMTQRHRVPKVSKVVKTALERVTVHSSEQPSRPPDQVAVSKGAGHRKSDRTEISEAVKPVEKERRRRENESERTRKVKDKEAEKERKRKEREDKKLEKQMAAELADANKLKTNKKASAQEMVVELPDTFPGPLRGLCERFMKEVSVETKSRTNSIPDVVRWERKITAEYDEQADLWKPKALRLDTQAHLLCLVQAKDFAHMIAREGDVRDDEGDGGVPSLSTHVARLRSLQPGSTLIYLLQGLEAYSRKNKSAENIAYRNAVLTNNESVPEANHPRRRAATKMQAPVSPEQLEDALLALQLTHSCKVHHTNSAVETAEFIRTMTEHLGTLPYRRQKANLYTGFCTEVGQIRTGENKEDTFVKMLQEVSKITPAVALGIATKYPDMRSLYWEYKREGKGAVAEIKKCANREGGFTDARIGPSVSKRLGKVVLGEDPMSYDV